MAVMLRVHCVQLFYNLSDPGMEDPLYESDPVRRFVGLKLSGALPDEITILNFRHMLGRHNLDLGLLEEINAHLESQGLKLREGPSWTPPSSRHRRPSRTGPGNGTRRCIRPGRGPSSISG